MSEPGSFAEAVSASLAQLTEQGRAELDAILPEATMLTDVAETLVTGGKRFRARLAYWGWRAAVTRGDPALDGDTDGFEPAILSLASGLELFHAAALVHDDIIDNSDTRRGVPSAHRRFETLHHERRLLGRAPQFGTSSAILLGDLLLAWADDRFLDAALHLPERAARDFRRELRAMRVEVTGGQFLDNHDTVGWRSVSDADAINRAQRVVLYKSAKYSVEAPLVLGAIAGDASPELLSALRGFAVPLGFAFQLRDDLLGVYGDTAVTGKPAGDDLREGKRTVLIAIARQRADRSTLSALDELIGDPELTDAQIAALRATLEKTGAVDAVEDLITRSRERSLRSLDDVRLDATVDAELRRLVDALTVRQH